MQAFERIIILAVFGAHISFVFYHFLADYDPIIPLVNDQLLHQIQVRRISQIFLQQRIGSESSWSKWLSPSSWSDWLPLQSVDHVLGSHGLGFPFVMHYQHFPHIIVGALGAFLRVRPQGLLSHSHFKNEMSFTPVAVPQQLLRIIRIQTSHLQFLLRLESAFYFHWRFSHP